MTKRFNMSRAETFGSRLAATAVFSDVALRFPHPLPLPLPLLRLSLLVGSNTDKHHPCSNYEKGHRPELEQQHRYS